MATPAFPRWLFMWTIAFSIYVGLKWLSWCNGSPSDAPTWKQIGYLLAWPGMDARSFLSPNSRPDPPKVHEWCLAAGKSGLGAALIAVGMRQVGKGPDLVAGWLEMIGLILLLHCGLFHLLSCLWRTMGIEARPIMNSPLLATGVAEFWGRRWNSAFRDLTHRFVFRPLTVRYGTATALCIGFLISGLVHELVITIPARDGYGGPTAFFALQAVVILLERSFAGRCMGLGRRWQGRSFAAIVLLAPVGLLFPPAFVCEIIVPFCHDVGGFVLNG